MRYLKNKEYGKDVEMTLRHTLDIGVFSGKKVLILGASGLIGSFITDCFIYANEKMGAGITIYAVSRDIGYLKDRFSCDLEDYLHFIESDVTLLDIEMGFDHIIHAASYGHPGAFREIPVEVFLSNVIGTQKVLELARLNPGCRVLYVSSGEVQEEVYHLSARACYPMGKKAAETLCVSHREEYGTDVVIVRPCHTFGANVTLKDNRAATQFIVSAAKGIDIEMYSAGEQERTFSYVADCASALLSVMARGESGGVYGISSGESCTVKEFADKCAVIGKCKVIQNMPTNKEKSESSPIRKQIIKNEGLKRLGWRPAFSIDEGIRRSIQIINGMSGI